MASESNFPDSLIDEDPQKALEALNEALKGDSTNAEWFCQRAYAHTLLKNYKCAVDDAKKAQQLQPNLPLAFMRTGIAEYHLNQYKSAHAAFTQGQQLDDSDKSFEVWIKRCDEVMGAQTQDSSTNRQTSAVPSVKHDWYQTESNVVVTVMAKNVSKDGVCVSFTDKELSAEVHLPSGENFQLHLHLLHPIIPEQSSFKILSTKVEFKMKKTEATRWEKLEGEGQESNIKHFNPSQSTHYCSSLHWPSSYFPPSKDQYGLRWLSAHAKARVGSGAPLEPFISLTVKVGSKDEGDDGKI